MTDLSKSIDPADFKLDIAGLIDKYRTSTKPGAVWHPIFTVAMHRAEWQAKQTREESYWYWLRAKLAEAMEKKR